MKKAYVVLGMHRSGTSSMAGTLALLGATPPKTLMGPAEDNPRGFWESYAVSNLNDRILASYGSSWSDSRPFPERLAVPFVDEGRDVLESEFGQAQTLVLKDPRICRLYPFWREVLQRSGYDPLAILIFRHPAQVQASLEFRNGISPADAARLWLRHVLDAERFTRGQARTWIRWSDFLSDWRTQLAKIENLASIDFALDDPSVADRISGFLSPDLQHHREDSGNDHPSALEVFATLTAIARGSETREYLDQIDGQRRRFEIDDTDAGLITD